MIIPKKKDSEPPERQLRIREFSIIARSNACAAEYMLFDPHCETRPDLDVSRQNGKYITFPRSGR